MGGLGHQPQPFNMAAQYGAAQLNFTAGAGKCPAAVTAATQAQQLLVAITFNGKTHGSMSAAQLSLANQLAKQLRPATAIKQ